MVDNLVQNLRIHAEIGGKAPPKRRSMVEAASFYIFVAGDPSEHRMAQQADA
jgi:hypothetical protein